MRPNRRTCWWRTMSWGPVSLTSTGTSVKPWDSAIISLLILQRYLFFYVLKKKNIQHTKKRVKLYNWYNQLALLWKLDAEHKKTVKFFIGKINFTIKTVCMFIEMIVSLRVILCTGHHISRFRVLLQWWGV